MSASNDVPKFVLLGKNESANTTIVEELLRTIKTKSIPGHLLDNIEVVLSNKERYAFPKSLLLGERFNHNDIEAYLQTVPIPDGIKINSVQVIVDLRKAQQELVRRTNQFLDPLFEATQDD